MTQPRIATLKTWHCIVCPHCGETNRDSSVDHLGTGQTFGTWYCDHCGGSYRGKIIDAEKPEVEITPLPDKCVTTFDLLELPPNHKAVYFVVRGMRFSQHENGGRDPNDWSYYYEEHSCPTYWLRKTVAVVTDKDPDPHGFLRFVRGVDAPIDPDTQRQTFCLDEEEIFELFPETLEDDALTNPTSVFAKALSGEMNVPVKLLDACDKDTIKEVLTENQFDASTSLDESWLEVSDKPTLLFVDTQTHELQRVLQTDAKEPEGNYTLYAGSDDVANSLAGVLVLSEGMTKGLDTDRIKTHWFFTLRTIEFAFACALGVEPKMVIIGHDGTRLKSCTFLFSDKLPTQPL